MIDDVDKRIIRLPAHRAELSRKAAAAKSAIGGTTYDPNREAELLKSRQAWGW